VDGHCKSQPRPKTRNPASGWTAGQGGGGFDPQFPLLYCASLKPQRSFWNLTTHTRRERAGLVRYWPTPPTTNQTILLATNCERFRLFFLFVLQKRSMQQKIRMGWWDGGGRAICHAHAAANCSAHSALSFPAYGSRCSYSRISTSQLLSAGLARFIHATNATRRPTLGCTTRYIRCKMARILSTSNLNETSTPFSYGGIRHRWGKAGQPPALEPW
jgi:hypothetical protein